MFGRLLFFRLTLILQLTVICADHKDTANHSSITADIGDNVNLTFTVKKDLVYCLRDGRDCICEINNRDVEPSADCRAGMTVSFERPSGDFTITLHNVSEDDNGIYKLCQVGVKEELWIVNLLIQTNNIDKQSIQNITARPPDNQPVTPSDPQSQRRANDDPNGSPEATPLNNVPAAHPPV